MNVIRQPIDIEGTRMMPLLLLRGRSFVKTTRFNDPVYLGDPLNTIRIFNEKAVDELIILDIDASRERRPPDFQYIASIAEEAFMPFAYGGGISSLADATSLVRIGVEKLILNSALHDQPSLATEVALKFGSQAVTALIDVQKNAFGSYRVSAGAARRARVSDPVEWARELEVAGVGEIVIQSVDRDGTMDGYDVALMQAVTSAVSVPVVACGGAAGISDMVRVVVEARASAVAAGALFVFYGPHRAVLINPPSQQEFSDALASRLS